MHELSIVQSMVNQLQQSLTSEQLPKVESISVKVGEFSGIIPDTMSFAFTAIKNETPFKNSKLDIVTVPFKASCKSCGSTFGMKERFIFICPECNSRDLDILSGKELYIESVELKS
ncbi:MAG: hydrogenase maturation nickel metallochaperone HypA [Elusimicrobiota bacterium]